jgi:hypothetical protein
MYKKILLTKLLSLTFIFSAMAYEEPKYQVVSQNEDFEIRQYAPMLIAEVYVEGDMDQASNKGFRLIADYIFGNNQAAGKPESEKISMTAPVTIEPVSSKIEMTTPVTIEPIGTESTIQNSKKWRFNFVMPRQYTINNIPKPNNNQVILKEIPEKFFVVYRYSGFNTLNRVQSKTDFTMEWIKSQDLTPISTPQLSRYDPPWTLPLFRRNEIMVEIKKPASNILK